MKQPIRTEAANDRLSVNSNGSERTIQSCLTHLSTWMKRKAVTTTATSALIKRSQSFPSASESLRSPPACAATWSGRRRRFSGPTCPATGPGARAPPSPSTREAGSRAASALRVSWNEKWTSVSQLWPEVHEKWLVVVPGRGDRRGFACLLHGWPRIRDKNFRKVGAGSGVTFYFRQYEFAWYI